MYIYIYIYIYICICTYIHTYIHACRQACMHACMHIYIYIYIYIHTHIHLASVLELHSHDVLCHRVMSTPNLRGSRALHPVVHHKDSANPDVDPGMSQHRYCQHRFKSSEYWWNRPCKYVSREYLKSCNQGRHEIKLHIVEQYIQQNGLILL